MKPYNFPSLLSPGRYLYDRRKFTPMLRCPSCRMLSEWTIHVQYIYKKRLKKTFSIHQNDSNLTSVTLVLLWYVLRKGKFARRQQQKTAEMTSEKKLKINGSIQPKYPALKSSFSWEWRVVRENAQFLPRQLKSGITLKWRKIERKEAKINICSDKREFVCHQITADNGVGWTWHLTIGTEVDCNHSTENRTEIIIRSAISARFNFRWSSKVAKRLAWHQPSQNVCFFAPKPPTAWLIPTKRVVCSLYINWYPRACVPFRNEVSIGALLPIAIQNTREIIILLKQSVILNWCSLTAQQAYAEIDEWHA